MSEVDGSYLVARTLKEENTECLFYLMGGPNYEIINNSEDLGIKTYDFRHEQAAAMAAHAYSRVTRKPGVTTAASGPGTLNLLTCLLYTSPSPRDGLLSRMPSSA